jgi:hypothetical protein
MSLQASGKELGMAILGSTDFGNGPELLTVDHDPTAVATLAKKGSLICDANGKLYRKMDDGSTTNVVPISPCMCKTDATAAPTVNDDVDLGYGVNSIWVDVSADKAYICTDPADGAAVWKEITPVGESYADRGDPSSVDFSIGSGLTADDTWRDLDLSSIVAAGGAGKLVHLRCRILDNAAETPMMLRKKGNSNAINAAKAVTAISGDSLYFDAWVMMDSSRVVQYNIDSGMGEAEVTVAGWMA